jgi:hypothetical protein
MDRNVFFRIKRLSIIYLSDEHEVKPCVRTGVDGYMSMVGSKGERLWSQAKPRSCDAITWKYPCPHGDLVSNVNGEHLWFTSKVHIYGFWRGLLASMTVHRLDRMSKSVFAATVPVKSALKRLLLGLGARLWFAWTTAWLLWPSFSDRFCWAKTSKGTCPWCVQVHVYGRFLRLKR